ncbi:hypothetical protein [Ruegeria sp. Ofav3-42]|uniref:hypothetical protein n=1 Tax=Ruegeria sp. Ofav3-42 TaxID=2917759 RepID=UPI001EF6677C|nr:hypothetical protein [Ruegeria sp. Ofav3-42]MCG7519076.1 hypothetical protein [Ruegeria sp. Ofav3-42]
MAKFRIVGISFDHMHMGDLLRTVHDHPDAEITAVFDPARDKMQAAVTAFDIPEDRVFTDFDTCMAAGPYDMALLGAVRRIRTSLSLPRKPRTYPEQS